MKCYRYRKLAHAMLVSSWRTIWWRKCRCLALIEAFHGFNVASVGQTKERAYDERAKRGANAKRMKNKE